MSLREAPSLRVVPNVYKSTILSNPSYVLAITSTRDYYAASASAPANKINLFAKSTLQPTQILTGHSKGITALRTIHALATFDRDVLLSAGKDGCLKIWDERSGSAALTLTPSRTARPLLCCDASPDGRIVAAGTDLQGEDALILYWDPRNPSAQLRSHSSTHSDDITSLHFLKQHKPEARPIVLSASSDGLISKSDAEEEDEDEAVQRVGNWGCSISQTGWIYSADTQRTRVWAASDMETFSCWSDELDILQDQDIRNPSVHNQRLTWMTDYLITGHSSELSPNELTVFVGSNEGDLALISCADLARPSAPWSLHRVWTGGHTGIVRSLLWDEENSVLLTGGEDSKVNLWPCPPLEAPLEPADEQDEGAMEVDRDEDTASNTSRKREWDSKTASEDSQQAGKRVKREQ